MSSASLAAVADCAFSSDTFPIVPANLGKSLSFAEYPPRSSPLNLINSRLRWLEHQCDRPSGGVVAPGTLYRTNSVTIRSGWKRPVAAWSLANKLEGTMATIGLSSTVTINDPQLRPSLIYSWKENRSTRRKGSGVSEPRCFASSRVPLASSRMRGQVSASFKFHAPVSR